MKQEWNTPITAKQFFDLAAGDKEFCEMLLVNKKNIEDAYKDVYSLNICNVITNIINYAARQGTRNAMDMLNLLHDFSLHNHSTHWKWKAYADCHAASAEYDTVYYNTSTDDVLLYYV